MKKSMSQLSFHLDAHEAKREGGQIQRVRQKRERERRESRLPVRALSGRQHKLVGRNLTTEDKRLRQRLLYAYLTCH